MAHCACDADGIVVNASEVQKSFELIQTTFRKLPSHVVWHHIFPFVGNFFPQYTCVNCGTRMAFIPSYTGESYFKHVKPSDKCWFGYRKNNTQPQMITLYAP